MVETCFIISKIKNRQSQRLSRFLSIESFPALNVIKALQDTLADLSLSHKPSSVAITGKLVSEPLQILPSRKKNWQTGWNLWKGWGVSGLNGLSLPLPPQTLAHLVQLPATLPVMQPITPPAQLLFYNLLQLSFKWHYFRNLNGKVPLRIRNQAT